MKRLWVLALCFLVLSAQSIRPRVFRSSGAERTSRAGVSSSSGGASCSTCLTGLVGYWSMDTQSDGGIGDLSGAGHNATLAQLPGAQMVWDGGVIATAVGSRTPPACNLDVVAFSNLTSSWAVSTWVKVRDNNNNYTCILCESSSEGLFLHADKFSYYVGSDHDSTVSWVADTWKHVVLNYNGTTLTYYFNGVQDNSHVVSITNFSLDSLACDTSSSFGLSGLMDETGVWTRVLTTAEITALYNSGSGLSFSQLH